MPLPIALIMIVAGALITWAGWRRPPADWGIYEPVPWITILGMALLLGGVNRGLDRVLNDKPEAHASAQQEHTQHSQPAQVVP